MTAGDRVFGAATFDLDDHVCRRISEGPLRTAVTASHVSSSDVYLGARLPHGEQDLSVAGPLPGPAVR